MELALERELSPKLERKINYRNVILTPRDLDILEFITDMKFSSYEDIYQKFFKFTLQNIESRSDHWARKRLLQLEQGKFLKSHKVQTEKTNYYTATFKSYYALTNVYPEKAFTKPVGGFDFRTFRHDKLILKCRLDLENKFKVANWISDRKLRASAELSGGLTAAQVPDGIYTKPDGTRIAFELEIARKTKSRYQDKVQRYVQLLRQHEVNKKKFDSVQFICTQDPVFELIDKETRIYGSLFKVQKLNQFISELNGGESV